MIRIVDHYINEVYINKRSVSSMEVVENVGTSFAENWDGMIITMNQGAIYYVERRDVIVYDVLNKLTKTK